jgi:regulator of sigma E protease
MNIVIMVAQLILGLSILVLLHEFGHYITARAFGIKVEKFYLFFDAWGFKLFKYTYKGTEYGIGWLPLGGYVKIAGMIDESMDKEQLSQPMQPWEFRSKPAWQRLIVMIGGVTVNLILGVILFTMVIMVFEKEYVPISAIDKGIYAYEMGRKVGFQTGDKIVAVGGKKIERFKDASPMMLVMGESFQVERNGQLKTITVNDAFYAEFKESKSKRIFEAYSNDCSIDSIIAMRPAVKSGFKIGDNPTAINDSIIIDSWGTFEENIIKFANKSIKITVLRNAEKIDLTITPDTAGIGVAHKLPIFPKTAYSFSQAIKYGWKDAMDMLSLNIKGMGKIFKGEEKATESLSGPIGIAQIYGGVWDWHKFWYITGLLSLILAFMNILPIPALDGGHVIFLIIEAITGKTFSDKFMERVQMVGMVLIMGLMIFAFGVDIFKLFR